MALPINSSFNFKDDSQTDNFIKTYVSALQAGGLQGQDLSNAINKSMAGQGYDASDIERALGYDAAKTNTLLGISAPTNVTSNAGALAQVANTANTDNLQATTGSTLGLTNLVNTESTGALTQAANNTATADTTAATGALTTVANDTATTGTTGALQQATAGADTLTGGAGNDIVKYHDGTTYSANQLNKLTGQITQLSSALGTDKYWKGDVFSAGQGANIGFDAATGARILGTDAITNKDQVALDMAAHLAKYGVTSLDQIGVGDLTGDVRAIQNVDENGVPTGTYSKWDSKTGQFVPADANDIRTVYTGDGQDQQQSLVATGVTGTGIVNKVTGEAIGSGNGDFGATYTGEGGTEYKMKIDPSTGLPIFYTVGVTSNDLAKIMADLGPIGQIGLAVATGGLSIPQQIAANMAVQALSGKDIGDVIKGAATSFLASQIPGSDFMKEGASFIKDLGLSKEFTDILTRGLQNAATSTASAVLSGQDAGKAFLQGFTTGGAGGAVNALMGNIEGFSDLTPAQKSIAVNAVTSLVSGKPLDQILINTAIAAANSEIAKAKGTTTGGSNSLVNKELENATTFDASKAVDINTAMQAADAAGYGKFTFGGQTYTFNNNAANTIAQLEADANAVTSNEIRSALTIDASGSKDLNAASAFARNQGYNNFTFGGQTYRLDDNNAANTIAQLEADALAATTAANLAGSDMAGVDAQAAATAKANNVVIGNAEADNPDEAAYLARQRNPTATTFTFGGSTYTLGTSNVAVNKALAEAKAVELTNNISNAPSRSEAFRIAREGGLGAKDVFTWQGKSYSAATGEERPDLSGTSKANTFTPTVTNFVTDKLNQNLSSAEFNPADLTKAEMTQFVNVYANATDAQKALLLKGADSMTFKVIDTLLKQTAALNPTGAGDQAAPAGSVDLKAGKAGLFTTAFEALQAQQKESSDAANAYLKANPNSSITNSVSTAYEAAGNIETNVGGGLALFFNNKPLSDALIKSGNDTTKMGQTIGTGVEDTKNWNDTMEMMSYASGVKKLGVMAGRIMDGTSGLSRQVQVELRQELPGLFLGGGSLKAIMIATGLMDVGETTGNATLGAYEASIKAGKTHAQALSDARVAGATAGAAEAAVQLTLGKLADFGAGKINNLAGKTTGKVVGEGIVEGTQEGGAALAVDLALGNPLNVNNYLTQTVAGAAVGKGTAVVTSASDIAQTDTINNTITAAVATGDTAGVSTAINNSVQTSLSGGASVEVAVGATVNSAITNGADAGSSITSAVTTAVESGADVSQTVTASVDSAITAGADSTVAINSTVTSAIASGADSTVVVTSAVTSAVTAGADVTSTVTTAVQAAVTAGADVATATTTATTAAVSASVNAGADVTTAITTGVSAAVTAGADVTTASNAAVTAAVTASVVAGTDTSTAISTSVIAAVEAGADVATAATTATTAAVTASITAGTDATTAITTAVDAAVNAGATVTTATNAAVTAAVTTSVATGANITTAIDTSVTAAVTAGANVNTAVTTAVTAAVESSITTAVNAGTSIATAVDTSVASSITAAATANTSVTSAVDTAVSTAITTAVTSGADVNTAVTSAVTTAITTAISSNVNASTAVTTAVDSAVTTAITSNVDATTAITTSVTAAIDATVNSAVNSNVAVTSTVNAAVTSAVNAAVTAGVDTNVAVDAAINAVVNANIDTNIDIDNLKTSATETATSATEKTELISTVNDLISGTSTAISTTPTTRTTTKTPTKTPAGLTAGLLGGAAMASEMDRLPPQMLKAYMTQDKFVDPLAKLQALQEGMNTEKMPALPQVNTQEEDMPDQGNWKYGTAPDDLDTLFGEKSEEEEGSLGFKAGGYVAPLQMASGGAMPLPLLVKSGGALGALPRGDGRMDFRHGAHVAGEGDGQSDDIKAMLADGEFVFPADVVSALGNGSTKAGSDKLYEMMHSIRARARSKKPKDLPPPALKSPLDYLKKRVRS